MTRDFKTNIETCLEVRKKVINYLKDHDNTFTGHPSELARKVNYTQKPYGYAPPVAHPDFLPWLTAWAAEGYFEIEQPSKTVIKIRL